VTLTWNPCCPVIRHYVRDIICVLVCAAASQQNAQCGAAEVIECGNAARDVLFSRHTSVSNSVAVINLSSVGHSDTYYSSFGQLFLVHSDACITSFVADLNVPKAFQGRRKMTPKPIDRCVCPSAGPSVTFEFWYNSNACRNQLDEI
jgi:hypothetical protein